MKILAFLFALISTLGAVSATAAGLPLRVSAACQTFAYSGTPLYQNLTFTTGVFTNGTLLTNAILSPACTTTGATIQDTSSTNADHGIFLNPAITLSPPNTYTFTVFYKPLIGDGLWAIAVFAQDFSSLFGMQGTNCTSGGTFGYGNFTNDTFVITYSNGWCKIVGTTQVATASIPQPLNLQLRSITTPPWTSPYVGAGANTLGWYGVDIR